MIEINADNNTANIFYPEINNTVGINLSTQMQMLKEIHKSTQKKIEYLIYGQSHYNAVWYNNDTQIKGKKKIKRKK